jgi:23S rRNA (pseudouridine1915-N3)-methyltransferase
VKQILILAVGRQKDAELRRMCEDYHRRCSHRVGIAERELKDLAALGRAIPRRDAVVVALDERGRQHDSRAFAALVRGWLEGPATTVVFLIGGADGLDDELRGRADHLLSLGRMTFAHRLVRLLLAEQLYRAVSILDGAPYHRD